MAADNNNNVMDFAFKLKFDIGTAEKDWKKYQKQLQDIIDKDRLSVKVAIDQNSVNKAMSVLQKVLDMEKKLSEPLKVGSSAAMIKAEGTSRAAVIKAEAIANERNTIALERANTERARQSNLAKTGEGITTRNAIATKKEAIANEALQRSKIQTANAQDRLNRSMSEGNRHLTSTRGLMNGLPQLASSYVSILGGIRFVQNLKDITGEFELQRVALAAIIQDKSKADALFGQVVELGLQSPFQIKELITYTKQLAAFRVENDQLFGTMSRLADISAGLGVSMDRLILAYGQVKAASVLRGQELRQFTEAGIPLVDMLAKEFTKLNGEMVTTGDVFELISKKQVPFGMIEKLFRQMTEEGGTFYQMQMIQSQTLRGAWSNLRDAYDKMYMEMGNANMGLLKAIPATLKSMADNWEGVLGVVSKSAIAYGAFRIAVMASNATIGKEEAGFLRTTMAAKAKRAEMLRQSSLYRKLTGEEAAAIWTSDRLTKSNLKRAVSSKMLTQDMALRLIATKKLNAAQIQMLVSMGFITKEQAAMAASASVARLTYLSLTASLRTFTAGLKAMAASMLLSPTTWFVAGLYAIVEIGARIIGKNNALEESIAKITTATGEYAIELKKSYEEVNDVVSRGLVAGADDKTVTMAINAIKGIIEKNEALKPLVQERVDNLDTEIEKLVELKKMYDEVVLAASGKTFDPSLIANAEDNTDGWWFIDQGLLDNTKDFNESIDGVTKKLQKLRTTQPEVAGIQKSFSDLVKQFKAGEIGADELSKKILSLSDEVDLGSKKGIKGWTSLGNKLRGTVDDLDILEKDFKQFGDFIKANIGEINGQKIDLTADKWGLTDANLNELKVNLQVYKEMWYRTADDIQKSVIDVLWGRSFMISNIVDPKPVLSKFADEYNNFVTSNKFKTISLITETGENITEESVIEKITSKLEEMKSEREKINRQIKEGNKYNEKDLSTLNASIPEYQKVVDYWGAIDKQSKQASKQKPVRVEQLEDEVSLLKEAYDKYQEYAKYVGSATSQKKVEEGFKGKFSDLSLAFNDEDMMKQLDEALSIFKKYGDKAAQEYFKTWNTRADIEFKGISDKIQAELKSMGDKIAQTEKANKFFEEMFNTTGDATLSKELALKITGFETGDISDKLSENLIKASKDLIGIEVPIVAGKIDIKAFRSALESIDKKSVGLDRFKIVDDLFQSFLDAETESVKKLFSGLSKYEDYESKKKKIIAKGEDQIALARKLGRDELLSTIDTGTQKQLAELEFENFKTSDMYSNMFQDLDKVSTEALRKIREKVIALSTTIGSDLSPTNFKDLIAKIGELDKEIISRDPFKEWIDSMNKLENLTTTMDAVKQVISVGKAAGLSEKELQLYNEILKKLQGEFTNLRFTSDAAFDEMVTGIQKVNNAAGEVSKSVREVFEEFGVGEETIAYKTLELFETISNGVSEAIQIASRDTEAALSAVDKASIILLIISTVIKVAMKIYSMFGSEAKMAAKIEKLTKQVEYLQAMYDKLNTETLSDPNQLKQLEQELALRKEMLELTSLQMQQELPGLSKAISKSLVSMINIIPESTKDWGNLFTLGVKSGLSALFNYGKMKKYKEYIEEANYRLEYQAELYDVLNSSINNIAKTAEYRVLNLQEQNRLLKEQLATEVARGRKMDVDKVLELQEQIAENEANISSAYIDTLYDAVGDVFTTMSDNISDALTTAFENGTDSAQAFAESIDKIMRNVIVDLWKANVLTKMIQPVMSSIYTAMGLNADGTVKDGVVPDYTIDLKEAKAILAAKEAISGTITDSFGSLEEILKMFSSDLDSSELTGISKAIGSMDEETALTLGNYANSILYYVVAQNAIQTRMLEIMESGDGSAMGTIPQLVAIQNEALSELRAISANTKRSANASERVADALDKLSIRGGRFINVNLIS